MTRYRLIVRDMRMFQDADKLVHKGDVEYIWTDRPVPVGYLELQWNEGTQQFAVLERPTLQVAPQAAGIPLGPSEREELERLRAERAPSSNPPKSTELSLREASIHSLREEGLGYSDIAERLGLTVGTVKKYAQDARTKTRSAA